MTEQIHKRLDEIHADVKTSKDNHLAHIQLYMETMSDDMKLMRTTMEGFHEKFAEFSGLKSDISWLKMIISITLTASIGGIIMAVFQLITKNT